MWQLLLPIFLPIGLRDLLGTAKGDQAWAYLEPILTSVMNGTPLPPLPAMSAGQAVESSLTLSGIQALLTHMIGTVKGNTVYQYLLPILSYVIAGQNPFPSLTNQINQEVSNGAAL